MNDRIRSAFDSIHAESELIDRTKNAVLTARRRSPARLLIPALCALVILLAGIGLSVFFTPDIIISIDVNPSLELGVNRFGRVISAEGFNNDGILLAKGLNVRFMLYKDAVGSILDSEELSSYIAANEEVVISVASLSGDAGTADDIAAEITRSAAVSGNVSCGSIGLGDASAAHAHGLSCGKYNVYLQLSSIYPDVTVDDVKNMTMREMRDMIDCGSDDRESEGGHGGGHYGHRHGAHN